MDDLLFGTIANDMLEPGPGLLVFSGAGMDLIDAAAGGGLGSRLYGGSGNDEIILDIDGRGFGSGGNDKLESAPSEENAGGNRLYGGPGDDQLTATYNDRLFGGSGNDILDVTGDGSQNRLYGGAGDDTLTAGTGDRLVGQDGNDLLIAAGGDSTLTGGAGADIFAAAPELPHLPNIITDFESGSDNIQLGNIENLAELLQQGSIASSGDGAVISIGDTPVFVLLGIEADSLVENDFVGGNNTIDNATNLGNVTDREVGDAGTVDDSDRVDFYKFTVDEESEVTITLTGLAADANLALINDENSDGIVDPGEAFAFSALEGTADEEIFTVLQEGSYFIRVRQQDGVGLTPYDLTVSAQGTDSTLATANDLGDLTNNSAVETGSVRTVDGLDYYKFSVTLDSTVEINLNGLEGTLTRLELIQDVNGDGLVSVGEQLASVFLNSDNLVNGISQSIAVGEYFVLVGLEQADTDYELTIDSQFRAADNSPATAVDLGDITDSSAADSDLVYDGDPRDFYQFQITEESEVTVNLTGLTGDGNLALIQDSDGDGAFDDGEAIAFSALEGTADEEIFQVLGAGNYFIRVRQDDGEVAPGLARYDLTVSAQGTDSTLATANDLGDLTNNSVVETGSVRTGDGLDYYKFSVTLDSTVEINLNGLEGILTRLELIQDINGDGQVAVEEQLASVFLNSEDLVDGITSSIAVGEYFVLVELEQADTDYELTIDSQFRAADNSPATAVDLGDITNSSAADSDLVYDGDPRDFYQFEITEESEVTVNLTGLTGDANLALIQDSDGDGEFDAGEAIAFSASEGTANEEIFQVLDAGNYFVRVRQDDGEVAPGLARYDLTVSAEGTDSTLATANDLGILTGSFAPINDSVRTGGDELDYYKFEITEDSTVDINLNGLEGILTRLELIQDVNGDGLVSVGEQLASVFLNSDNLVDGISQSIAAGEYFVLVGLEQGDTNYELNIGIPVFLPSP